MSGVDINGLSPRNISNAVDSLNTHEGDSLISHEGLESRKISNTSEDKDKPQRQKLFSVQGACKNIAFNILTLAISLLTLAYAAVSWQANGTSPVGSREHKLLEIAKYVSHFPRIG
jgi:hypothetical protein